MQLFKVWMAQSLWNCDSLIWIISQHLFQEVNYVRIGSFEQLVEVLSVSFWQLEHKLFVLFVFNLINQF